MNTVVLSGKVTKDLVLEEIGDKQKCVFTVAVRRDFKNAQGQYEADFVRCVAWGSNAKYLTQYASKGSTVEVKGEIRTGSYEKNGVKQYTTDVFVDKVSVMKAQTSAGESTATATATSAQNENFVPSSAIDVDVDELPFI